MPPLPLLIALMMIALLFAPLAMLFFFVVGNPSWQPLVAHAKNDPGMALKRTLPFAALCAYAGKTRAVSSSAATARMQVPALTRHCEAAHGGFLVYLYGAAQRIEADPWHGQQTADELSVALNGQTSHPSPLLDRFDGDAFRLEIRANVLVKDLLMSSESALSS
jgi:hypothetical protein